MIHSGLALTGVLSDVTVLLTVALNMYGIDRRGGGFLNKELTGRKQYRVVRLYPDRTISRQAFPLFLLFITAVVKATESHQSAAHNSHILAVVIAVLTIDPP